MPQTKPVMAMKFYGGFDSMKNIFVMGKQLTVLGWLLAACFAFSASAWGLSLIHI